MMELKKRYINAVAARLIDNMAFSLLEVTGQENFIALIRRRGRSLELLFFVSDEEHRAYVNLAQPHRIKEHMIRLNCNRATVVNIFLDKYRGGFDIYMPREIYSDISFINVQVDIESGIVSGDTSRLNRLRAILQEYANVSGLSGYTVVDLKKHGRIDIDAKPVVTRCIIAVNVLMWILMTLAGGSTDIEVLIRFGAMYSPLVLRGEYWRFITPMFLHVGLMHLLFNSYALYQLGGLAERIYGKCRFIMIYVFAGICGSFFSFIFTRAVSAGASGAIFGMLGALLYFGRKRPHVFRRGFTTNLVTILLINLFIGFSNPGIDNFAHLGGLAGGYISSRGFLKSG